MAIDVHAIEAAARRAERAANLDVAYDGQLGPGGVASAIFLFPAGVISVRVPLYADVGEDVMMFCRRARGAALRAGAVGMVFGLPEAS